tara:strand:+ start:129 stop:668 length:540 start_codon:yes stop_codon:yes gene_type:complete
MENLKEDEGFFRTLINKVPANMRFFASDILGIDTPGSNKNFTNNQLSLMRDTALNALEGKNTAKINYEDYPSGESDVSYQDKGVMSLASKMLDDEFQMRTTIGGANVTVNEEGDIILTDKFNFNNAEDINDLEDVKNALIDIFGTDGAYNKLRKIGTYAGSGYGKGAPIELNLGKYKDK